MSKQKTQDPKPIMFRPTTAQESIIKELIKDEKLSTIDNKADAIKYLIDLGIFARKDGYIR